MPLSLVRRELPKAKPASKTVTKKFEALGPIAWGTVVTVPGGYAALIDGPSADMRRLALLGEKDKTARFIEGLAAGNLLITDVARQTLLVTVPDENTGRCDHFEVSLPGGKVERVYQGPWRSARLGPPGFLVLEEEKHAGLFLIATDGKQGRVCSRQAIAEVSAGSHLGTAEGTIHLVSREYPHEDLVVLGVFGEELRQIGVLRHGSTMGGDLKQAEGGIFFGKKQELLGLADAYAESAGAAAPQSKRAPKAAARFIRGDPSLLDVPAVVERLPKLKFRRSTLLPCAAGFVTMLEYSAKKFGLAIVDAKTHDVKVTEMPKGEAFLSLAEGGDRLLLFGSNWLREMSLPDGVTRELQRPKAGTEDRVIFDFATDGMIVMATASSIHLLAPGAEKNSLVEAGHAKIPSIYSMVTGHAGRVVVVDCAGKAEGSCRTLLYGIYGRTLRPLGEAERGDRNLKFKWFLKSSWDRVGARLVSDGATDELVGLAEAYDQGAQRS